MQNALQHVSSPWDLIKYCNLLKAYMPKEDIYKADVIKQTLAHPDCDVADVWEAQIFLTRYIEPLKLELNYRDFKKQYRKTLKSSKEASAACLDLSNLTTLSLKL